MKYLYTECGTQFQVSDEDEIFLAGFIWYLSGNYIQESRVGKRKRRYLHHIIAKRMGLDFPDEIDHKDGNPLNNQRDNLRPATHSQNMANSKSNNTSGYKGVSWDERRQKMEITD